MRTKGKLNQHNVTLVIAAMREGGRKDLAAPGIMAGENEMTKIPLVSRLATFISATSFELEEMNKRLESANERLERAAITDGLTGLYNRRETQYQIEKALENLSNEKLSLIMLDIDNFKRVNDTFGHQQGDAVIRGLSNILQDAQTVYKPQVLSGRWGGEEFMIVLHDMDIKTAAGIAERIRQYFEDMDFPPMQKQTASLGVTQAREDDTADTLCTRVDMALYQAKASGKNQVVVME